LIEPNQTNLRSFNLYWPFITRANHKLEKADPYCILTLVILDIPARSMVTPYNASAISIVFESHGALAFTYEGRYGKEDKLIDEHVTWWREMVEFVTVSEVRYLVFRLFQ